MTFTMSIIDFFRAAYNTPIIFSETEKITDMCRAVFKNLCSQDVFHRLFHLILLTYHRMMLKLYQSGN